MQVWHIFVPFYSDNSTMTTNSLLITLSKFIYLGVFWGSVLNYITTYYKKSMLL